MILAKHRMEQRGLLIAVTLITSSAALAERPRYRVEAFEPYPGNRIVWTWPEAINNQNSVAGYSTGPVETRATRWDPDGTMLGLDYHAFPRARALDLNESNVAAGYSYYEWDMWEAAIWAPDGSVTPLGGLWSFYDGLSEIHAINDFGVAAGVSSSDTQPARAFRWTAETGMVDIGTLGGPTAWANGINNLGQIVGGSVTSDLLAIAFEYHDDQFMQLHPFSGGTTSEARDINDAGQIVGAGEVGPTLPGEFGGMHAALWQLPSAPDNRQPPEPMDLGVPILGGQSLAVAINSIGQVVGIADDPNDPGDYIVPWIWEAGVMRDLRELIPPDTGWLLYQVYDINDQGWIVGVDVYGQDSGFVLIPLEIGDIDYDGDVDLADLATLLANYGTTTGADYGDGDLDEDGDVDLTDLAALLSVYGIGNAQGAGSVYGTQVSVDRAKPSRCDGCQPWTYAWKYGRRRVIRRGGAPRDPVARAGVCWFLGQIPPPCGRRDDRRAVVENAGDTVCGMAGGTAQTRSSAALVRRGPAAFNSGFTCVCRYSRVLLRCQADEPLGIEHAAPFDTRKRRVDFQAVDEVVRLAVLLDLLAGLLGVLADAFVELLAVAAMFDGFHQDVFGGDEGQLGSYASADRLGIDNEPVEDVVQQDGQRVGGQKRLGNDQPLVARVVERAFKHLSGERHRRRRRQADQVAGQAGGPFAAHGVALVRHRRAADL